MFDRLKSVSRPAALRARDFARVGAWAGLLAAGLALGGCDTLAGRGPLAALDLPDTPTPDGPWPKLADIPRVPAFGAYGPGAPDPVIGQEIAARLEMEAAASEVEAEALSAPVISSAQSARLRQAGRQARAAE